MTAETALSDDVHCPEPISTAYTSLKRPPQSTFVFRSLVAFHLWGK